MGFHFLFKERVQNNGEFYKTDFELFMSNDNMKLLYFLIY